MMRQLDVHANKLENEAILTVQCVSTCKFRLYHFIAHCQAKGKLNIHFSNTTTHSAATLTFHIWSDNADVSYRVRCLRPFMLITRSKRRKKITRPGGTHTAYL